MIATGHDPHIYLGRDGRWNYCERMYEIRYDKYTREEEFALRSKKCAASTGTERIIAERIRRQLTG